MTTTSETKSRTKQVLLKIYGKRFHWNNQQVCIDCVKPISNKNELECKKCGCMYVIIKAFHYEVLPIL